MPRWIVYQRERFPVLAHGALIAAFSIGAVCFSAQLRAARDGAAFSVRAGSLVVAFVSCLLFFFQLRVADEFKDFDDDLRCRPYRPVPRGLVTLRELSVVAAAAASADPAGARAVARAAPGVAAARRLGLLGLMTRSSGSGSGCAAHPSRALVAHGDPSR